MSETPLNRSGNRIVVDTNIFVSGIFWYKASYDILNLWRDGKIKLVISLEMLEELRRVLMNFKIRLPVDTIDMQIDLIKENSILVEPVERFSVVKDSSDNKFVECAVAGDASYIITYDKELLKLDGFRNIKIIKPEEYLRL